MEKAALVDISQKDAVLSNTDDTDKRDLYRSKGMDEECVQQLIGMDLEILRLFEI